ncbi:MAG: YceI family protein [Chitinophagaceae bacterium]
MKKIHLVVMALLCMEMVTAQELFVTRHGQVSFFGKTPLENIEAVNNEASSVLNLQTGEVGFALLVKGFHFERALMEDHFNENYMESDKMPKASFKGKITNASSIVPGKDGSYAVTATGDITVHGITKTITVSGTIVIKNAVPQLLAKFVIMPKDYGIKIPSLVADKIADRMNVSVDCQYEKK